MIFEYKYKGFSKVDGGAGKTAMRFAPDTSREPTWFHGKLNRKLPFREAISALHHVVISDLRYTPKSSETYQDWLKEQEDVWLAEFMQQQSKDQHKIDALTAEMKDIRHNEHQILDPFYKARDKYYRHLYVANRDWWMVLDPVITVHPDEISFECFSLDESSYGRLSCSHNVFDSLGDFSCGTTNIYYSAGLYQEFQKIRNYKDTELTIDPDGFSVETEKDDAFREVKIDLPDSWVRGFLQVSSAMTMGGAEIDLHPMDLHNICFHLKRRREKKGPRSLRFKLIPGQPVSIQVDPWGDVIECPRSVYYGSEAQEIRIWGRRRLLTLERLVPVAKNVRVKLLGYGMPSFWTVDMGEMQFTLGLSGWTANDWSRAGNFDLLAPRAQVSAEDVSSVIAGLGETWFEQADDLAKKLGMDKSRVLGALGIATQEGRTIYDANKEVWRLRELSGDPLPFGKLRYSNDRERLAQALVDHGRVKFTISNIEGIRTLSGVVGKFTPIAVIDKDERLQQGVCTCSFHIQNKLMKGPCEHIIALRVAESSEHKK